MRQVHLRVLSNRWHCRLVLNNFKSIDITPPDAVTTQPERPSEAGAVRLLGVLKEASSTD